MPPTPMSRRAVDRLGCEVFQIPRMKSEYGVEEGPLFQTMTIQHGRHEKDHRARTRPHQRDAAHRQRREARTGPGFRNHPCAAMRRVGRLFRHHGEPRARRRCRSPRQAWRRGHPLRKRRRSMARSTCSPAAPRRGRWVKSSSPSSNGGRPIPSATRARWTITLARQQGGRATTILEKSLGAAAKGGTTTLAGVYHYAEKVTAKGFVYMDTPGYDPRLRHGAGGGRGEHALLHHRARQRLWLQTHPQHQDRHQQRYLSPHDRRHGYQCR